MNKTFKLYGFLFLVMMAFLTVIQLSKKETIDWQKNFDTEEKSPFGLYVFDQEAKNILDVSLRKTDKTPYEYLNNVVPEPKNYLIIEKEIDNESQKKILKAVKQGSDVFIISRFFYGPILDSLKIGHVTRINYDDTNTLHFTDPQLAKDSLFLDKAPDRTGFRYINKKADILGYTSSSRVDGASFIRMQYGKGSIYIHTEPLFLSNYYLLQKGKEKYAEAVFSYLPKRETIWFTDSTSFQSGSLLRFILLNPPLKYAWWTLLGGLLLFIIFNAKRKQRIVPVIEPLRNKSVEFVKSIGNLYLQEGDFHDMMAKKAQYFLHKIRTELLIDTSALDEDFVKKLQLKTGKSEEKILEALVLIKKGTDPSASVIKEDLIRMNQLLDELLKS